MARRNPASMRPTAYYIAILVNKVIPVCVAKDAKKICCHRQILQYIMGKWMLEICNVFNIFIENNITKSISHYDRKNGYIFSLWRCFMRIYLQAEYIILKLNNCLIIWENRSKGEIRYIFIDMLCAIMYSDLY